jgi:nicotinamidase-related amidase
MSQEREKGRTQGLPELPDERMIIGKPLLLIIDMQYDFMEQAAPCYNIGAEDTVAPTAGLIHLFRERNLPIIFTREAHRPGRVDAGIEADPAYHTPAHTVEGTRGYEIVTELSPVPGEFIVDKRRYNCFLGTELELLLKPLAIDTMVICGVSSDMCVHWTAGEAYQRDFHVRVVEDCTAGMSLPDHEASLLMLRNLSSGGRPVYSWDITKAIEAKVPASVG